MGLGQLTKLLIFRKVAEHKMQKLDAKSLIAIIAPLAVVFMGIQLLISQREVQRLHSLSLLCKRAFDESKNCVQKPLSDAEDYMLMAEMFPTDDYLIKPQFYKPMGEIHRKYRDHKNFTIVEFGRGEGGSTWFWPTWFPQALLVSVDILPWQGSYKKPTLKDRVVLIQGSQTDNKTMSDICAKHKNIQLIIDDASHLNRATIHTFEAMFPCLNIGGTYVVEDIQTSYSKVTGGSCDPTDPNTMVNYFKTLIDQVNLVDVGPFSPWVKSKFAESITGLHFYHDLLIIDKGENKGQQSTNHVPLCWPFLY